MTRFRIWWEAMDAVLERRGEPPLSFEEAQRWFYCEIEPEDVPTFPSAAVHHAAPRRAAAPRNAAQRNDPPKDDVPWDDRFYEEKLPRGWRPDEQS
jgi:hypothetical protein